LVFGGGRGSLATIAAILLSYCDRDDRLHCSAAGAGMVVFQPPAGCCGQPILDGSMGVRMCGQEVPDGLDWSMWASRGGLLVFRDD
jgi:hypothetical protein